MANVVLIMPPASRIASFDANNDAVNDPLPPTIVGFTTDKPTDMMLSAGVR
jgi:hypothetical protein